MAIKKRTSEVLLPDINPGDILLEDFLKPLEITQYRLAKGLKVSQTKVSEIIKGKRSITAETALRLGKYFCMSPEYWMNLQSLCDLQKARRKINQKIEKEVLPLKSLA